MERQISKEELITEVKRLLLEQNISSAIELCSQALITLPLNGEIYTLRGMLYTIGGNKDKASDDIQKANKLSSKTTLSDSLLEMIRRILTAKENNAMSLEKYYEEAKSALAKNPPDLINAYVNYSEIIRRDKRAVHAYLQRADVLFAMKKYEECADDCISAIALDKDNLEAFIILARAHFTAHHYIQASAACEVVLLLDNKNIDGHYIWAMACYELKQYQQAIDICTQYFVINPNSSIFYCARACCYFALGELQNGEEDYRKAISLNTVLQETYVGRIQEAKMIYCHDVLTFADKEPKINLIQCDVALLEKRAESFKKHVTTLKTLIKDQKVKAGERILSEYCLAELYAKCRYTYLHKFNSVYQWPEKNAFRIQKAACHYIVALDKLINGPMFNQLLLTCIVNKVIQDNATSHNSHHVCNRCVNSMSTDEIIASKIKLCLDVVLGISQLYVESKLSRECFLTLNSDYRERLKSCLDRAIPIIIEKSEDAQLLFDHLSETSDTIFDFFDIKIKQPMNVYSKKTM